MADRYHLAREYAVRPFIRWACTVEYDPEAEEGYRVVDHDPQVADAGFLHRMGEHLARPSRRMTSVAVDDGDVIADAIVPTAPGTPEHLAAAIGGVPGAIRVGRGRP